MWKCHSKLSLWLKLQEEWLFSGKIKIVAAFMLCACIFTQTASASIFRQEVIEAAANEPLLDFKDDLQNAPMNQAKAIYFMAMVVYHDSAATYGSGKLVRDRLLEQFKSLLTPGSEPNANGSLSGWTHGSIAHAFLLAKNTSAVWSRLTNKEKEKIDWLMKAMAVAGHFCFDDGNDFRTGLGNEGNFYKLSNPNYSEGYVGCVVAASLYFGADSLNRIFKEFSYVEYINRFSSSDLNFPNILSRWKNYDWGPILENGGSHPRGGKGEGVRNTFTYQGVGLDDPFGIFKKLADVMYGVGYFYGNNPWTQSSLVFDGLTVNGVVYSQTLNNGTSPYLGQPGMCYEFHSSDGSGANTRPRSHINYVSDGWGNSVCTRASLEVLGYWKGQPDSLAKVERRMFVGSEDFLYKAGKGFRGYSSGKPKGDVYEAELISNRGHAYPKEIWQSMLKKTDNITELQNQ